MPTLTPQHFVQIYEDNGRLVGGHGFNTHRFIIRGICSGFRTEDDAELILALPGNKGISAYVDEVSIPQIKALRPYDAVILLRLAVQQNPFGRVELRDCMFIHENLLTSTVAHFLWKDYSVWKVNKNISSTNGDNQPAPPIA